jgi:hypothetical protein
MGSAGGALSTESPASPGTSRREADQLPASPRSAWARWLVPSVRDVVFVVLLFALTCSGLTQRLLSDGGTGWHIRTGQIILTTHAIPHSDPFSLSTAGRPWYAWEWLADVAMGAADRWAGLNGVVLLAALVIAATFSLLLVTLRSRGSGLFTSLVLVLLAFSASTIHLYARPHVASWLLTVVWLWILGTSQPESARRRLWWLPLLMLLWVNLHGGFLVGSVLLVIYWLDAAWDAHTKSDPHVQRRARSLGLVTVASALVTLLNPYAYNLYIHIYQYLTDRFLMEHIQEFQSPDFHGVAQKCFAALILLALGSLALSQRKLPLRDLLILLFAVYMGLYASRNLPTSSILIAVVIGPLWSIPSRQTQEGSETGSGGLGIVALEDRMGQMDAALRGCVWQVVAVAVCIWMVSHGGKLSSSLRMQAEFPATRFPVNAVNFVRQPTTIGPIFSTDQWGGYLIYRLYPTKILVDDRHDLYGAEFFKRYLKIVRIEPGWQDLLRGMHPDFILVPAESSMAGALLGTSKWSVQYRDSTAILFSRAGSRALPGAPDSQRVSTLTPITAVTSTEVFP